MADNVAVTEGAGKTIATDDIQVDGTHTQGQVQYVKLVDGTGNGTGSIRVNQAAKANALTVAPASDIADATYIGDIKFGENLPGGTIDTVTAITNDVNIADGGNSITVDGTVTANLSATDNTVLDNIDSNTDYGAQVGGGTEAAALRVTIANNSTGVVSVDDNGGALTVDGTVTANLSATDNTVLDNIDSNTDYGAVVGGGAEATALRVTIANDSTGVVSVDDGGGALTVDNGGTFAVQAASAGDVAHDTADSGNPVKVGGKAVNFDGTVPGTAVAENDRANLITDVYGRLFVETAHPRYFNARGDYAAAQTNTTVQAAPGVGLKLYITDIMISNGATAGNITLLDGSGGTVLFEIYPAINGGCTSNFRTPIVLTANTLLAITSTTVTTHSIAVQGYIAP